MSLMKKEEPVVVWGDDDRESLSLNLLIMSSIIARKLHNESNGVAIHSILICDKSQITPNPSQAIASRRQRSPTHHCWAPIGLSVELNICAIIAIPALCLSVTQYMLYYWLNITYLIIFSFSANYSKNVSLITKILFSIALFRNFLVIRRSILFRALHANQSPGLTVIKFHRCHCHRCSPLL